MNVGPNKPVVVPVHYTNIGKTPARRIEYRFVVEKVASDQPPSLTYTQDQPRYLLGNAGILVPNDSEEIEAVMLSKEKNSLFDPPVLTQSDVEELMAGKAYIATFGRITYCDIYDVPHWIQFCARTVFAPGTSNALTCTQYNDTDNNDARERICE